MTSALVFGLVLASARSLAAGPGTRSPYDRADRAPSLPAPFLLPDLAHRKLDLRLDSLLGRIASEGSRGGAMVSHMRFSAEGSFLVPRRLFVGVQYPLASALPPDGGLAPGERGLPAGRRTLPGNIEAHVRAVFPLPTSLEIGFMLAVAAPTAAIGRDRADRSAALAAASLDPTDVPLFLPGRVSLRPAADLRILRGPLVLQGRHGIDIMIDGAGTETVKLAGRLIAHVGWLPRPDLELSFEASQLYFFASEERVDATVSAENAFAEKYRITDERRSLLTLGPGIRYALRDADLGLSLITNLGNPLAPSGSGFFGLRISVIGHVRPSR